MANIIATNFGEFSTATADYFDNLAGGASVFDAAAFANFWSNGAGQAFKNTNNTGSVYRTKNIVSATELYSHMRQRLDAAGASRGIACFNESGTNHIEVWQSTTGNLYVTRAGTLLTTGTGVYSTALGRVLSLQIYVKIDDTVGRVIIRVDGATSNEIDFTGDTRNAGSGVMNQIGFLCGGANDVGTQWTDWVVNDTSGSFMNSWPGACRVALGALTITGGSGVQFTPSASTNVSNIDDGVAGAHDADSTYNEDSTAGHKDWFQLASSVFTGMSPTSISCVRVKYWARAADGGSHTFRSNAKAGGTTVNGATATLGSSYALREDVYYTDPSTSAAWASFAAITGAEFGYEYVS